jgi:hypothetical protein
MAELYWRCVVLFLFAYLLKSAVGIDLFPGHTGDNLQNL